MRLARFLHEGRQDFGVIEDGMLHVAEGDFFGIFSQTGQRLDLDAAQLLPPAAPSKIVAVGLNYKAHSEEFGEDVPEEPKLFLKPPSAIVAHGEHIVCPKQAKRVDYEAELALVIGKKCAAVSEQTAEEYILGYTCFNDVTARDLQARDGQWTRAKGFDTFAPVGPWIETDVNPDSLEIRLLLNGKVKQRSNTSQFIFPVRRLVSFISHVMTLLPGDIITTGTPSGVGPMHAGDTVTVSIEGVGELTNYVK